MQPELLHRFPGHDRHDPSRLGDVDLDAGEQAVRLDRAHHATEAVARGQPFGAVVGAEPLDLGRRDDAAVRGVPLDADLALAIPTPQRVEADPERTRCLRRGEILPRHCLVTITRGPGWRRRPSPAGLATQVYAPSPIESAASAAA